MLLNEEAKLRDEVIHGPAYPQCFKGDGMVDVEVGDEKHTVPTAKFMYRLLLKHEHRMDMIELKLYGLMFLSIALAAVLIATGI